MFHKRGTSRPDKVSKEVTGNDCIGFSLGGRFSAASAHHSDTSATAARRGTITPDPSESFFADINISALFLDVPGVGQTLFDVDLEQQLQLGVS
jgi:dienelactone hydrolase